MNKTCAIILAAGKGTRMNAPYPKVLAPLRGKPLVHWALEQVQRSGVSDVVVVVGYQAEAVREALRDEWKQIKFAVQDEQLGTGHAARIGLVQAPQDAKTILVTYGDHPFISAKTYASLIEKQQADKAAVAFTSFFVEEPSLYGYGRVKRDQKGAIVKIVEQKVATPQELLITECNAGAVAYDAQWLRANLDKLKKSPVGEYYLTDLAELAASQRQKVETITVQDTREMHGINTLEHLEQAELMIPTAV